MHLDVHLAVPLPHLLCFAAGETSREWSIPADDLPYTPHRDHSQDLQGYGEVSYPGSTAGGDHAAVIEAHIWIATADGYEVGAMRG